MLFGKRSLFAAVALFLFGANVGIAAKIEVISLPGVEVPLVSLSGPIEQGDGDKFAEFVEKLERASIILNSPGGVVKDALQIGATIQLSGYTTMVVEGHECFSACGLIWVSGVRRYMSKTSVIGFHAAYREENGEYRESGVANAEIGSYLTHLGLRIEAIRFFTIAGPSDFLLLTPDRARVLGIEVYTIDGGAINEPSTSPTVDTLADRFVAYAVLQSRCGAFLKPDIVALQNAREATAKDGISLVSNEDWIKLWSPLLDGAKSQLNSKGALLLCIETEATLRKQGQETGVHGPSFSCNSPSTGTERALCSEASLWAKDRAINSIYFWLRNNLEKPVRKRLLTVQRQWLSVRNECGSDVYCLNTVYDQRLHELREIDLPI